LIIKKRREKCFAEGRERGERGRGGFGLLLCDGLALFAIHILSKKERRFAFVVIVNLKSKEKRLRLFV